MGGSTSPEWWVNINRNGGSTWFGIYTYSKKHIFAIIASILALFVWWQEKVNVTESEQQISDFHRLESNIHQLQLAVIIYRQATSYTLRKPSEFRMLKDTSYKNVSINDSIYLSALISDIKNEVLQEIECVYTYERQSDLKGTKTSVFDEEKANKKNELDAVIKSKNLGIMTNYVRQQRQDYSESQPALQKSSQEYLNKLWFNSKCQFNLYIIGYLIAALLFFIDKICNAKIEEQNCNAKRSNS